MHTLRHVSINVCGRMRNSASTFMYTNKLEIIIRYEHATVRWYTLSYGEGVQKSCTCLYVRHKLDEGYM